MTRQLQAIPPDLEQIYESDGDDVSFAFILSRTMLRSDSTLAETIEADGRIRAARRLEVTLLRYLDAVPGLASKPDALDAAIDVTLRSMSGGSIISRVAVHALCSQHPELAEPIEEAAALSAAVWSTTGLRTRVSRPPSKPLPSEFGPLLPTRERRYVLQQLLGQGAFGQVYLARDRQLSEDDHTALVAIKLLATDSQTAAARRRIVDEAVKVRRISHPNVVQVLDRGLTELDEEFIVYEYVNGGDLGQLLAQGERRSVPENVTLISQICRGVHAAHSAGVIHCDLKPGNIMMTSAGQPKVADFGIAVRLGERPSDRPDYRTERLGPIGNIAFISPEQYRGGDHAFSIPSDIYALGGMLFLLLTGVLPNGDTFDAIDRTHDPAHGRTAAPSAREHQPRIDRDLDAVCRRAMAIDPDDRHSSAAALADDLDRWLRREPIEWTRPGLVHRIRLLAARKPGLAVASLLILALVIAGSAVAIHLGSLARQRQFDVAMAKLQLDTENQRKAQAIALAQKAMASIRSIGTNYRLNSEALTAVWAYEYVFGPKVLGVPVADADLWIGRVHNIRQLVKAAREQGRPADMETLLMESALGFWLTCDHDFAEAEPLLAENRAKWGKLLHADDAWLSDLQLIAECAASNRLIAGAKEKPLDAAAVAEAAELAAKLTARDAAMLPDHRGTSLHALLLARLLELQSPGLLNQPDRAAAIAKTIESLKDSASAAKPATQPKP